ncbi:unnamed protein product [Anisakis simplex]|uniref:Uncharacterized protein n=1 Tax=Anisakis simplex TaxID=6269 RepID=A0A0M3JA24_ANISI|nr:unnamed protein product [Anisakis simplex]
MKPNLRNADVKSSRHGSLSPKDGTQTPTKIQPKRRAKSAIKDYSLLLLNKPSINYSGNRAKVVDDGTPSKIIASQLQKVNFQYSFIFVLILIPITQR